MSDDVANLTPEQAGAKLAELSAKPEWAGKLISKADGGAEKREFATLMAAKSGGSSSLDKIIAGTAEAPLVDLVTDGKLSVRNQMISAEGLREMGVGDDAIRQVFESKPVSKAEHDAAVTLRADCLANPEFTKKLLAGDRVAARNLALMNIVIIGGFREAA